MNAPHFTKAGLLCLFLLIITIAAWEVYLRSKNVTIAYDDGKQLWADKRLRVYQPSDEATVFIGSSRIKYDLDIPTWRKLTGEDAVQLAAEGTSPLPVLDDLAADENFKGKLVIDVTEGLFFGNVGGGPNDIYSFISYAKKRSPAEEASFVLNRPLESSFVFLDKDNFSLNAFLDKLELKSRPGVFQMPIFPIGFGRIDFDRQNRMTDEFLSDTNQVKQVTEIWQFLGRAMREPPASGGKLDSFFAVIKDRVAKIKNRGGQVIFVRTPSSGPFWMMEQQGFPRNQYWDPLLKHANSPGIHFTDYPQIAGFTCPEWSHLIPKDAVTFTEHFVALLQQHGWRFGKSSASLSQINPKP